MRFAAAWWGGGCCCGLGVNFFLFSFFRLVLIYDEVQERVKFEKVIAVLDFRCLARVKEV